jgi:GntR family transcriptional repressor for pyruvate dehydrogenase complex
MAEPAFRKGAAGYHVGVATTAASLFRPIPTRRTFEQALNQIAEAIASGHYRAGDRLPSERALAEAMQVGRPTIREAFNALADAGVVEVVGKGRGGGVVVRSEVLPVTLGSNRDEMRLHEVGDLLVARRMLEPLVAQLAAAQRSDADVERLQSLLRAQRESTDDRARFLDLDLRFHQEIARCAHNDTVRSLATVIVRRLESAYDLAIRDPLETTSNAALEQHAAIVAAIAARDAEGSGAAMLRHLRLLEGLWAEETGYSFVPTVPGFLADAVHPPTSA